VLPPGLYEAVMTPKNPNDPSADLISGDYLVRFEARSLDDIRAFGGNSVEDERQFAAVARVSEINLGLYRTFLQPWVRALVNEGSAEWMRRLHTLRLQYELFSDTNPFMHALPAMAEDVRQNRQPVGQDNPLLQAQEAVSQQLEQALKRFGEVRDRTSEDLFHAIYGSPLLQALVGLKASDANPRRRPGTDAEHMANVARCIAELKARLGEGGTREAAIRSLLYIRMPEGAFDERVFAFIRLIRDEHGGGLTLAAFKQLVRDQFFILLLDEDHAVAAIPAMFARDRAGAALAGRELRRLTEAVGLGSEIAKARLARIEAMFAAIREASASDIERLGEAVSAGLRTDPSRRGRSSKRPAA
jgi:Protein of unknown function (DUF3141)